jgi:hypothetical protein
MNDYIFLMHNDVPADARTGDAEWESYFATLGRTGRFDGGSTIGTGVCYNKRTDPPAIADHLGGYIRVRAENIQQARTLLDGNPVYEAGGTVEIRELPETGSRAGDGNRTRTISLEG